MGYRIGYQCFEQKHEAHDWLLSQQPPLITADGQLIRPIKQGKDWYLNGQQIDLSFPECNIGEQIQFGAMLAAPFIGLFALIWAFHLAKRLIEYMGASGGSDD